MKGPKKVSEYALDSGPVRVVRVIGILGNSTDGEGNVGTGKDHSVHQTSHGFAVRYAMRKR